MRFAAPEHTTEAHISTGTVAVKDGFIDVPDDTPINDIAGLVANGFQPQGKSPAETKAATVADTGKKD